VEEVEEVEEVEAEEVEAEEVEAEEVYPSHQQVEAEAEAEVEVEAAEVLQEDHHHTPTEDSKETLPSNSQAIEKEARLSCLPSKSIEE